MAGRKAEKRVVLDAKAFTAALKAKGVSQAQLSKDLGITPATICNAKRGRHELSLANYKAICEYLGADPGTLWVSKKN